MSLLISHIFSAEFWAIKLLLVGVPRVTGIQVNFHSFLLWIMDRIYSKISENHGNSLEFPLM